MTKSIDVEINRLFYYDIAYRVLISGLKYAASEPKTMGRTFLRLVSKCLIVFFFSLLLVLPTKNLLKGGIFLRKLYKYLNRY